MLRVIFDWFVILLMTAAFYCAVYWLLLQLQLREETAENRVDIFPQPESELPSDFGKCLLDEPPVDKPTPLGKLVPFPFREAGQVGASPGVAEQPGDMGPAEGGDHV